MEDPIPGAFEIYRLIDEEFGFGLKTANGQTIYWETKR